MKAFKRVFKYVWPQWHRLVVIVVSAMMIAILFAFSIGTVLPLLKVMMGEEGLHGWIDRVIAKDRYGIGFYVPDKIDLSEPNNHDVIYFIRVTDVTDKSRASNAGIQSDDWIIGIASTFNELNTAEIEPSAKLLEKLATAKNNTELAIRCKRLASDGRIELLDLKLAAGQKPFYADFIQQTISFLPRELSRANTKKAVIFIIIMLAVVTAIRCTARFYQDYTVQKVMNTSIAHLREDTFVHSMDIPAGFFCRPGYQ